MTSEIRATRPGMMQRWAARFMLIGGILSSVGIAVAYYCHSQFLVYSSEANFAVPCLDEASCIRMGQLQYSYVFQAQSLEGTYASATVAGEILAAVGALIFVIGLLVFAMTIRSTKKVESPPKRQHNQ